MLTLLKDANGVAYHSSGPGSFQCSQKPDLRVDNVTGLQELNFPVYASTRFGNSLVTNTAPVDSLSVELLALSTAQTNIYCVLRDYGVGFQGSVIVTNMYGGALSIDQRKGGTLGLTGGLQTGEFFQYYTIVLIELVPWESSVTVGVGNTAGPLVTACSLQSAALLSNSSHANASSALVSINTSAVNSTLPSNCALGPDPVSNNYYKGVLRDVPYPGVSVVRIAVADLFAYAMKPQASWFYLELTIQGRLSCEGGYYCPINYSLPQPCPAGSSCRVGSTEPIPCSALSLCPPLTDVPDQSVGPLIFCSLAAALLLLAKYHRSGSFLAQAAFEAARTVRDAIIARLTLDYVSQKKRQKFVRKVKRAAPSLSMSYAAANSFFMSVRVLAAAKKAMTANERSSRVLQLMNDAKQQKHAKLRIEYRNVMTSLYDGGYVILRNISGSFRAGCLHALMGGSGSGKTSYLTTLFGRNDPGIIRYDDHSTISLEGRRTFAKSLGALGAYMQQVDVLPEGATVHEAIMQSARLFGPQDVSEDEREISAARCERLLGIYEIRNSVIGGANKRGISGGQKRRAALACEMVTAPLLLAADEPTSGLDSHAANLLVQGLSTLAHEDGVNIICTIHQPREDTFLLFDTVTLFAKGNMRYSGPVRDAEAFFLRQGYTKGNMTIPDFLIECCESPAKVDSKEIEAYKKRANTLPSPRLLRVSAAAASAGDRPPAEVAADAGASFSRRMVPILPPLKENVSPPRADLKSEERGGDERDTHDGTITVQQSAVNVNSSSHLRGPAPLTGVPQARVRRHTLASFRKVSPEQESRDTDTPLAEQQPSRRYCLCCAGAGARGRRYLAISSVVESFLWGGFFSGLAAFMFAYAIAIHAGISTDDEYTTSNTAASLPAAVLIACALALIVERVLSLALAGARSPLATSPQPGVSAGSDLGTADQEDALRAVVLMKHLQNKPFTPLDLIDMVTSFLIIACEVLLVIIMAAVPSAPPLLSLLLSTVALTRVFQRLVRLRLGPLEVLVRAVSDMIYSCCSSETQRKHALQRKGRNARDFHEILEHMSTQAMWAYAGAPTVGTKANITQYVPLKSGKEEAQWYVKVLERSFCAKSVRACCRAESRPSSAQSKSTSPTSASVSAAGNSRKILQSTPAPLPLAEARGLGSFASPEFQVVASAAGAKGAPTIKVEEEAGGGGGGTESSEQQLPALTPNSSRVVFVEQDTSPYEPIPTRLNPSFLRQLFVFYEREFIEVIASSSTIFINHVTLLAAGGFIGYVLRVDLSDQSQVTLLFMRGFLSQLLLQLTAAPTAIASFTRDEALYFKDRARGSSALAFFIAKLTTHLLTTALMPLCFILAYIPAAQSYAAWTRLYPICWGTQWGASGLAMFFAALAPDRAFVLMNTGMVINGIANSFIPQLKFFRDNLELGDNYVYAVGWSYTRWTTEGFTIAEVEQAPGAIKSWTEYLVKSFLFSTSNYNACFGALLIIGLVYRVFAFVALVTRKRYLQVT